MHAVGKQEYARSLANHPGMDAVTAWYALACAQLGARATMRLLEAFQRPEAVLAASPREWTARAKLSASGCQRLQSVQQRDLTADFARLKRLGIALIPLHDPAYPPLLRTIPDPPAVLFVKGTLPAEDLPTIAIVGSRRASPYGRHVAAELAANLAQRGIVVVSGMALGADAAAHDGCLRAGGTTLAVLGCGPDVIYPPEHADLYARIAATGAIISEMPPGSTPTRMSFPLRNRVISGLSLGVVVVEAPEKSGALITATHALEQGREVFAVPGSVNSVQSRGTHQLLRDGAKLVESVEDILEELDWRPAPTRRRTVPLAGPNWDAVGVIGGTVQQAPPQRATTPAASKPARTKKARPAPDPVPTPAPVPPLPPEEATVLGLLGATAVHVDDLVQRAALPPSQVNAALLMLELKGLAQRQPGNLYLRLS